MSRCHTRETIDGARLRSYFLTFSFIFARFGHFGGFVSAVSLVSVVSFRPFRFIVSGFSTCRVSHFALRLGVLQVCASLSSLTFSSRFVCFLWTVLPCLFMFTNTIAYAFRCQLRKQLYLIAFVDLVPVAKEKLSLIQWNTVWNRWKSTLSARSIRVNLNHGKEM